ncbi:replicative DNA helicase, partial [Streptomyces sp. NPDC054796]
VYLAVLELYSQDTKQALSTAPGIEAVVTLLEERGELAQAGGAAYVRGLATVYASMHKATQAAHTVRALAMLRRLKNAAQHVESLADEAEAETAEHVADTAQAEILAACTGRPESLLPALTLGDVLEGALDEIESLSRPNNLTGVPTGFTDLDAFTGGLRPGQLIVLAGRPAMGQTTLATDLLRSAAIKHALPAAMFTRDATANDIGMRLMAAEARVPRHHMLTGSLTDEDWTRLARVMPGIADAPIYLQDDANSNFTQLRAQCRRLRALRDVRLIVIDTIQMLDYGTRPLGSRYEEVSEIARRLKLLALELEIPIVAVSTLNRNPEQREDKRPRLNDLRDSGALEDVADLVILLHREDAYDKESPRAGEADLIIAKFNNGPTDTAACTVAFQGHYARFVDMATT